MEPFIVPLLFGRSSRDILACFLLSTCRWLVPPRGSGAACLQSAAKQAKASAGVGARASAPAEVSIVVLVSQILLGVMLKNDFRGLERRRKLAYTQSREFALKTDSNVTNRVYISTLLGSLKTGAYDSA